MKLLWQARTDNGKTGNIPTAYVGTTVAETRASCLAAGCPLVAKKHGGNGGCYAWGGQVAYAYVTLLKNGKIGSIGAALRGRHKTARYARLTALGDSVAVPARRLREAAQRLRQAGLGLLGYTHGWRKASATHRRLLLASCGSLSEADEALSAGWRAAVILPRDFSGRSTRTPAGHKVARCPATLPELAGKLTCNDCGLCDASRKGINIIGFPAHGIATRTLP